MRIIKVIKNQNGIFLVSKYFKNETLKLGEFFVLDYQGCCFFFEVTEMETSEDGSIICYLREVGNPIQEMLDENNPHLLSEIDDLDIRNILFLRMR